MDDTTEEQLRKRNMFYKVLLVERTLLKLQEHSTELILNVKERMYNNELSQKDLQTAVRILDHIKKSRFQGYTLLDTIIQTKFEMRKSLKEADVQYCLECIERMKKQ